jgi:hypothetical protein
MGVSLSVLASTELAGAGEISQVVERAKKTVRQLFISAPGDRYHTHLKAAMAGARIYEGNITSGLRLKTTQTVNVIVGVPKKRDRTAAESVVALYNRYEGVKVAETFAFEFFQVKLNPG